MRKSLQFALILTGLVSFAGAVPMGQSAAGPQPALASVSGRVVDGVTLRPVPGALVSTWRASGTPDMRKVITDADGRFAIVEVGAGRRELMAECPGYGPGRVGQVRPGGVSHTLEVVAGQPVSATVPVWKPAIISGAVTDEAGEPAIGVVVSAWRLQTDARVFGRRVYWQPPTLSTTTDDRGAYRIAVPPGERYVVVVPAAVLVAAPASGHGDLEDAAATSAPPRAGYRVGDSIVRGFDTAGQANRPTAVSPAPDATGRAYVYRTTFYPGGSAPAEATVLSPASGAEAGGLNIQLAPAAGRVISGRVVVPDGAAANLRVRVLPRFANELGIATSADVAAGVTDEGGRFTIVGVAAGDYLLKVIELPSAPRPGTTVQSGTGMSLGASSGSVRTPVGNPLFAERDISVGESDLRDIELRAERGSRITGRVIFEGEAPPQASIQRIGLALSALAAPPNAIPVARPQPDGTFATAEYPPGRYVFTVSTEPTGWSVRGATIDGANVIDRSFELTGDVKDVTVVFAREKASLSGTVRDDKGSPDAKAVVLLFPVDFAERVGKGMDTRRAQEIRVSAAGVFSLSDVPVGDYFAIAVTDGVLESWQDVKTLSSLVASAAKVTIGDGPARTLDLRTQHVR